MTEISDLSTLFVRQLELSAPRPLRGTELSVLARATYPDFRPLAFGCRTLRDFIRRNIPDVVEFGRAGKDVNYQLRSAWEQPTQPKEQSLAMRQLSTDQRLWKTFATPESAFHIYLIPETESVVVKHPNAVPLPGWKEIPKMSAPALLQIGRDFAADQDGTAKAILDPLLVEKKWWIPYFERLQSLGLKSKWIEFRRRRIHEEFQRLLTEASQSEISVAIAPHHPSPEIKTTVEPIRKIAAEVISRMTESELRALNLPLGYIMDALVAQ
jgi:hypothetical protein